MKKKIVEKGTTSIKLGKHCPKRMSNTNTWAEIVEHICRGLEELNGYDLDKVEIKKVTIDFKVTE